MKRQSKELVLYLCKSFFCVLTVWRIVSWILYSHKLSLPMHLIFLFCLIQTEKNNQSSPRHFPMVVAFSPQIAVVYEARLKNGQSKQLWMCLGHFFVGVCRYPQIVSSALNLHITSRTVVLSTFNFMSMSSTYNIVWQALWHDVGGEEQQHWSKHWSIYNHMLIAIV